jgi:hypothetical protein
MRPQAVRAFRLPSCPESPQFNPEGDSSFVELPLPKPPDRRTASLPSPFVTKATTRRRLPHFPCLGRTTSRRPPALLLFSWLESPNFRRIPRPYPHDQPLTPEAIAHPQQPPWPRSATTCWGPSTSCRIWCSTPLAMTL